MAQSRVQLKLVAFCLMHRKFILMKYTGALRKNFLMLFH
ncbi:hypothetical protein Goarm_013999 [Gossypium armourianum]|uniref:Uncharacterized protein n=1 Tax=Gossypium armourianum TaxID=34283 RepID=A0A7J9J4P4_9ROSI|nr:hypothetical protein [Gossypium armourianum]